MTNEADKYKPGDLVRVVSVRICNPSLVGKIVMITKPREYVTDVDGMQVLAYGTDCAYGPDGYAFHPAEHQLVPVDYDGNKPGSWDECLWKPTKPSNTPAPYYFGYKFNWKLVDDDYKFEG